MTKFKPLATHFAVAALPLISFLASCNTGDDDTWGKYKPWREANVAFYNSQRDSLDSDGRLFYTTIYPQWNPQAEILIHYFNDREETRNNLRPLWTSTCDIIYYARMYNNIPFDSSYTQTAYGPAIARFKPNQTVTGFGIALTDMHVGDSAQIVIPYALGYGASTSTLLNPYSTLVFNLRLVDIPCYEINQ